VAGVPEPGAPVDLGASVGAAGSAECVLCAGGLCAGCQNSQAQGQQVPAQED